MRSHRRHLLLARVTSAVTILLAVVTAVSLMIPWCSEADSGPNLITFAWAWQDMSSGIYIDRQFDWPSGEALWVDVPVWVVQVGLLAMTGMAVWLHWRMVGRTEQARRMQP